MNYSEFERALSATRLNRYLQACNNDKQRTLKLYHLNIHLSQDFYAILSLLEVTLRNVIDEHYGLHFNDKEWLKNQCTNTGFLNNIAFATAQFKSRRKVEEAIKKLGTKYTHDRLVAAISFGFWINLFAPMQFRLAGQTLHKTFVNRVRGTTARSLYKDLASILEFRNRIAHYEPICFNHKHQIDLASAKHHYLIVEKTEWLGFTPKSLFDGLDQIQQTINKISTL